MPINVINSGPLILIKCLYRPSSWRQRNWPLLCLLPLHISVLLWNGVKNWFFFQISLKVSANAVIRVTRIDYRWIETKGKWKFLFIQHFFIINLTLNHIQFRVDSSERCKHLKSAYPFVSRWKSTFYLRDTNLK